MDDLHEALAEADTAAEHMVVNIPKAHVETLARDVIAALGGQPFDCADTVFVTNAEGLLCGFVRLNDLFRHASARMGDIMQSVHRAVRLTDDQEAIAELAIRYDMICVPVMDEAQRLIGAVPPEALFRILREEHMEDMERLAGIGTTEAAPEAETLAQRFFRRMPWLVFGLLASSVITMVMVGFEHTLSQNVAAAFFVPALVYIAGAIGTQAVSVSVRSLSMSDVKIGPLLRDELIIGVAIGTALGLMAAGAVYLSFGQAPLALAVGLAVLGGGAVSALAGFALPWLFLRLGFDPALGSGPICTIVQDAASLMLYFLLVTVLVL